MKFKYLTPTLALAFMVIVSCSTSSNKKAQVNESTGVTISSIEQHIRTWPEASKNAVFDMYEKYGLPSEVNEHSLVWYNTSPFNKTVVNRDEVPHQFPLPHSDVLEQTVDYKIPVNKADDILAFDGSIILNRTKGEMTVMGDSEEMNILSLNLADQIAKGEMTTEEARRQYTQASQNFLSGNLTKNTTKILFDRPESTSDADETMQAAEQVTE